MVDEHANGSPKKLSANEQKIFSRIEVCDLFQPIVNLFVKYEIEDDFGS